MNCLRLKFFILIKKKRKQIKKYYYFFIFTGSIPIFYYKIFILNINANKEYKNKGVLI